MTYYKILQDGKSCNGGKAEWDLPVKNLDSTWEPGGWMPEIKGKLIACERGYHICKDEQVIKWLDDEIYEVEYKGEIFDHSDKCVAHKCRLIRKYDKWDERTQRLFACDCAEHVLHYFEDKDPDDKRPRLAIESARLFVKATQSAQAVRDAAQAAALAAGDAAWAAGAAAWYAAWYAAGAAAWYAALAAAGAAGAAARDAAGYAAWYAAGAAGDATGDETGDETGDAEIQWQYAKLLEYIE